MGVLGLISAGGINRALISNKRAGASRALIVGILIAVILVGALAAFLFFAGRTKTPTTTTVPAGGSVVISLGQTPRLLGPGITMNYTLTLIPGLGATGEATVTAETPAGITSIIDPTTVNLTKGDVALDLGVHASDTLSPGEYRVGIRVSWQGGSSNLTYNYRVVQHLVLLLGGFAGPGPFFPGSVSVKVGDTVTWLSVDAGSDEYAGQRTVQVIELNQTSPTLTLYSAWAYTFTAAGTYHIQDALNLGKIPDEIVVVS